MRTLLWHVYCSLAVGVWAHTYERITNYRFPPHFMMGTATSAYQIEGAWNESGKGPSIWDTYVHNRHFIVDSTNGDIAADSYHRMHDDVKALLMLGVDFYRFSISWSRILPTGFINVVNEAGIEHYNTLINLLLANGIEPVVTMYHWDLPQPLQDLGGWANPIMADYFEDYAYVLFSNFGDRVKWWITINEPTSIGFGYNDSRIFAPGVDSPGVGYYLAAHTMILSHARAYHLYNKDFRSSQRGKIGIAVVGDWFLPQTNSNADKKAAEDILEFQLGLFANPIFSAEGDYPLIVKEQLRKISLAQGYRRSRLRQFTPKEVKYIRGAYDFMGLNYYTSMVAKAEDTSTDLKFSTDTKTILSIDPKWPRSNAAYIQVVPRGFRKLLGWIKEAYSNVPVFVTENGFPDVGEIRDQARITYIISHLNEMLKAMHEDGCNVIGYTYWSLLDNFEWHEGYTQKFGLFHVDFKDPKRSRTPKTSARIFSEITRTRQLPKYYMEVDNEISVDIAFASNVTKHYELNGRSYEPKATDVSSKGTVVTSSEALLCLCATLTVCRR